jgi:hypothetical protein
MPQTSSAVAPARFARRICGARSSDPAGTFTSIATASGLRENARRSDCAPSSP